jgi:outer membrane protein assembly factor BamB
MRFFKLTVGGVAVLCMAALCQAADVPEAKTYGWRGNWTGLYPEASPPAQWGRIPNGVLAGMTCLAAKPAGGAAPSGQPIEKGLIRDWLVLGPFEVAGSAKGLAEEQVPGEAELAPHVGQQAGKLAWRRAEIHKKPNYELWGTPSLDWLDLGEILGFKPNQAAYAFTYLYAPRAGKAVMVLDHCCGLKVRLNGTVVYENAERATGLDNYVGISRQKQELTHYKSPKFELLLKRGWNRLLLKISSAPPNSWREMNFAARIYDPDPTAYEEKNIVWMARLPERTNACPLVVGDRIFTPAEPDELVCLDKATGKILWRRTNTLYDAMPEAERTAHPDLRAQADPLVAELARTDDYEKGLALRRKLQELLVAADKKKYKLKWDGHFASHFGIIGFTTTPVSDGRCVYAFFGYGVVACYDLDGNRQWIRRLAAKEVGYTCSPALAGGRLFCVFGGLHALDPATGNEAWANPEAGCIASIIPMRVGGTDAITLQGSAVFRAADGQSLWTNPDKGGGWGAPLFLDQRLYMLILSVSDLRVADFTGCQGDAWQPKCRRFEIEAIKRRPNGEWLDRSSPASPLVYNGLAYAIDEYGTLYCADLATGKTLYRREADFDELHSYNHIGVAASPTLLGKYIAVMDNQGSCLVFEPGRVFKQVAMNRIQTMLPRDWPIPPQETIANGPPVPDGDRLYIRGEQYLYCIGAK